MRTALALAFLLSLAPVAVPAQNSSAAKSPASEILAANSEWARAVLRQEPEALGKIMSPAYRLTFASNDKSVDLPTWMRNFMKMKMHAYSPQVTRLQLLGPDTVAATISSNWEATLANGRPVRETFTAVDTWQRIEGRWIAVGRHVVDLKVVDPAESK